MGEGMWRYVGLALAGLSLVGLVLAGAGCERKAEQAGGEGGPHPVQWKMASSFAGTLPIIGTGGPYFVERLKTITRGRIDIRFYDPGKLVPALEVFDAASSGAVDAGWTAAGYWIGKIPATAFFTAVPFGPDASEYLAWMYHGGGLEIWRELYAKSNLYTIPCQLHPPEASGWFREPIESVAQIEGMKMRYAGMGGQALQKLGASVQLLAAGDLYAAMERGVLDATEFSMPSIDVSLGLAKIAKHYYFPGWHQQTSVAELIVNLERWNELDEADQMLIETMCKDTIVRGMTLGDFQQVDALRQIEAQGVTLHSWSPEMLRAFRSAYEAVLEENAAADPGFARTWESYRTFREQYAEWARLSRVPRDL